MEISRFIANEGEKLGKRKRDIQLDKKKDNNCKGITVSTGVFDYLGDEIILTMLPDEKIISDEGYTDYALESILGNNDFSNVRLLIQAHHIEYIDDYKQSLIIHYTEDNHIEAIKKLTACIVDIYAGLEI